MITCPDGTEIRVKVTRIVGGKIHIGYDAPSRYVIDREAIYMRKRAETRKVRAALDVVDGT